MISRLSRFRRLLVDRMRQSFVFLISIVFCSCSQAPPARVSSVWIDNLPPVILWAWERPENLEFIDTEKIGIAFLSQTLVLTGDEVVFRPRRQPLNVSPSTKLIAVTRIEARKQVGGDIALSEGQREKLVELILKTLELENVTAVQIDFDVATSERRFYRGLIEDLRRRLPENIPLSITALSSFCLGDRWMDGLQVDEAIPMIFRMGKDQDSIREHLKGGGDFREPLCLGSYGISLDEPLDMKFDYSRRIYVFSPAPWTERDMTRISELMQR